MRTVLRTGKGSLGLNFMWLPTWIGMNAQLVRELEDKLEPMLVGKPFNDETLDHAHSMVLEYLCHKFQIEGLFEYLDGLKYLPEQT